MPMPESHTAPALSRLCGIFLLTSFKAKSFYLRFLYPKFFVSKISLYLILLSYFFGQHFFWTNTDLDLSFPQFFLDPALSGLKFFGHRFFGPKKKFPNLLLTKQQPQPQL